MPRGASLSGAFDLASRVRSADEGARRDFDKIFGAGVDVSGGENDLLALASQLVRSETPRPMLYACCGTEDFLYLDNIRFREHVRSLGIGLTYEEGPGKHEWGYWDRQNHRVLEWLPLKGED